MAQPDNTASTSPYLDAGAYSRIQQWDERPCALRLDLGLNEQTLVL
jgi:hypothetical protein